MRPSPLAVLIFALTLAAFGVTIMAHASAPETAYQVIVHPDNPHSTVERQFLQDAFLKRVTTWPADGTMRPVDLAPNSPTRRKFTQDVLKRSVDDVRGYWQQRIFSGRDLPPPELDTDDEVVKYVLKHEGAVGYVSSAANINGSKVLTVR
jgi:ABC-type phosphate transport system substrate-binding protein